MCGILDANSAHEVFGMSPTPAGEDFLDWINSEKGALVVGGKQLEELRRAVSERYYEWANEAILDGRLRLEDQIRVTAETERLTNTGGCKSNDEHIIALAIISGARLLYSHDVDLQTDFKNRGLFSESPILDGVRRVLRGKVFPTGTTSKAGRSRKAMLQSENLCQPKRCGRRR